MATTVEINRIPKIQHGDLMIDPQCYIVNLKGERIRLFPKEFDVLYLLVQYPHWVLSAKQIYEAIWETESEDYGHIISNIIYQLRKKLGKPEMIQTVVERGYKFIRK